METSTDNDFLLFARLSGCRQQITEIENTLCERHMPLAKSICKEFKGDRAEIFSAAMLGLLRGIRYFKIEKGTKTSTYLTFAIRSAIKEMESKKPLPTVPIGAVSEILISTNADEEKAVTDSMETIIRQNLVGLPPRQIRIIRSLYVGDITYTFREVADKYGLTVPNVKKIAARGLKMLKEHHDNVH
jgi:RNA polymerase sigma factor (sigma-70 family)